MTLAMRKTEQNILQNCNWMTFDTNGFASGHMGVRFMCGGVEDGFGLQGANRKGKNSLIEAKPAIRYPRTNHRQCMDRA